MTEHAGNQARTEPLISVMLPVYEPGPMLIEALEAVLAQRRDFSAQRMQVAAVDDSSHRVDVKALLRPFIDSGQIEYHSNPANLGLAGNWNRCVELARGTFVHLLHQDDVVRPGFYARLIAGLDCTPAAGMAFCRHGFIDRDGVMTDVSHRERRSPGVLRNWLPKISRETRIQSPAAIVRRSVYERLGGFRADLRYALDWEMWTRIAVHHDVWYEPCVLADYRRHAASETTRLQASGATDLDVLRAIEVIGAQLPTQYRRDLTGRADLAFARRRIKRARKFLEHREYSSAQTALRHSEQALMRAPSGVTQWAYEWRMKRLMREASVGPHVYST